MDLYLLIVNVYVQLWPLWLVLAFLMTNLLLTFVKAFAAAGNENVPVNVFSITASITALALFIAAVLNVFICVLKMFGVK